jgi:AcrR family transcriptional regulator
MTEELSNGWFKRTEYDRSEAETRKRLLRAAADVFTTQGYAGSSIARITEAAGVSRASFYVYFKSREDVFHELIDDLIERTLQAQRGSTSTTTNPHAALTATIEAVLLLYADRSELVAILEERAKVDPLARKKWDLLWGRQTKRAVRWVRRLQSEGTADPDVDPQLVCEAMNAVLLHFGTRHRNSPPSKLSRVRDDLTALYERMLGMSPTKGAGPVHSQSEGEAIR